MIKINTENQNNKREIDLSKIRKISRIVLGEMKIPDSEINIVFVTNSKMRVINRKYFGRDRATDVISFPSGTGIDSNTCGDPASDRGKKRRKDSPAGHIFLGDIAISSDKASQNAEIYGTEFSEEIALYVIHGILHLLGYDDTAKEPGILMRRKENELLQKTRKYF
ncbi:MAG: rRNA maturation RNase YbeY [Candidatus Omnitrophota bacterium]